MEDLIRNLDDATAERILATITRPRLRAGGVEAGWTPELGRALGEAFDVAPAAGGATSAGDLARQALLVLAEDPQHREGLAALIRGPRPESFGVVTTAVVVSAVLVVLQTHVKFERDKTGHWSVKAEKKPTKDALLAPLVQKLLGFLSTRPPGTA